MGQLRDRMIRDLTLRNFSPQTIRTYTHVGQQFAAHYMRSPEALGDEQIRGFLLHMIQKRRISKSRYRQVYAALKFLYTVTLRRPFEVDTIPVPRKLAGRLPVVLSGSEVAALLRAVRLPKYRAIVMTLYGSGLRVSEACRLKVADIDSKRGLVRVEQGKGMKDRYGLLPNVLLHTLREWWRQARPTTYLFPGQQEGHACAETVRVSVRDAAAHAGIKKHVTPHVLRHSLATHLLELGVDVKIIQAVLGHQQIGTTSGYLQVRGDLLRRVQNPLDLLGSEAAKVLG